MTFLEKNNDPAPKNTKVGRVPPMPWLRLQVASCKARLDLTSMTWLPMSALSETMSPAACNVGAIAQNNGWGMGVCNTSTSCTHTVDRFIDY